MEYSIKCVLNGKPFEMTKWTVEKHEKLLDEMIPYEKLKDDGKLSQAAYDKKYRTLMIIISLREIDKNIKENDLEQLHPDDFIDLWITVYNSGKEGIRVKKQDFQVGENPPLD